MEEIDVLCINCENLISIDLISSHSLECVTPINFITPENSHDQVNSINQRLAKLCSSIQASMSKKKQTCTKTFLSLESLLRKAQRAKSLNISQTTEPSQFVTLIHEIEMSSDEQFSLAVQVYAERLKVLIEEKALVIPPKDKETDRQFFTKNDEPYSTTTKRELSDFYPSEFFRDKKSYLNDIDSVIESQSRRSLSLASSVQFENTESKKSIYLEELIEENNYDSGDEDLDLDYFVSQCLMVQLSYPSSHPVQKVNTKELFKESKMKKIDFEGWEKFIEAKFKEIS
ncbi:hypothetical protein SteCoe_8138 [Stentor coeruleus]|uniref:Uncharacterized protein n=1 Tax=Stentor coeruleus TaxID=5963 RepID=A0A1R2CL46_9CILI|nr:hypothetical protein SteCoe_8138 [Stentor coeruleus]